MRRGDGDSAETAATAAAAAAAATLRQRRSGGATATTATAPATAPATVFNAAPSEASKERVREHAKAAIEEELRVREELVNQRWASLQATMAVQGLIASRIQQEAALQPAAGQI